MDSAVHPPPEGLVDLERPSHHAVWIFGALFIACLLTGVSFFAYDAKDYWNSAVSLLDGVEPAGGQLKVRGALTAAVYTPAAALAKIVGDSSAPFFVLVQNSALIAWVGAHLVPRLLAVRGTVTAQGRLAVAFVTWVTLAGFAPYPIMDLYAATLCLVAVSFLGSARWWSLALAGLAAAAAANIRPAYVIPIALLLVVVAVRYRWRAGFVLLGALVALVPQVLLNWLRYDTLSLSPVMTDFLVGLQADYASYIVRYDTYLFSIPPQQFYCSPAMARAAAENPVTSTGELVMTFLQNMPHSIVFALQKIAASLHWPVASPYSTVDVGLNGLFGVGVTIVAVVGVASIVGSIRRRASATTNLQAILLSTLAIGTALTLVSSATETRFAVCVVMIGIVGVGFRVDDWFARAVRPSRRAVVITLLLVCVVVLFGYWGLAHPAPTGKITPLVCAG